MMSKRTQAGDAGAGMLILMVALMAAFFWSGGMRHGGRHSGIPTSEPSIGTTEKTALELLDEAHARGEIPPEDFERQRVALSQR